MKQQPERSTQEVLAGLVERVTYHNEENGFCVLRIKARGHRDLVTVIGHLAAVSAGEWVTASGEWINDRTQGQQFKAKFLKTSAPTSLDGIEKYLGSGMIRGIGPVYAEKLVRAFGEKVFDTIEAEPHRENAGDVALIECMDGNAGADELSCNLRLEIGKSENEVGLEREDLGNIGRSEGRNAWLLSSDLVRPHRITGYPHDAVLLTEKVKRFDRLLRQADDPGGRKLAH
jgi:DNA-binding Lrp family transcriptional regulator